ncbi:hypothetical protein Hsar01_00592 [Haloferula sargassicola]|uniref:Uncharacterized protein n=2 Tax=Haloferula sargassicola TaxID=490096 RepID=A0ABP9UNM7_9BACT
MAWACVPCLVLGLLVLTAGIVLKEQPLFWRNIGGYPVWLRDLVRIFFWPWLGICVAGLGSWSAWILGATAQRGRGFAAATWAAAGFWTTFGCLMVYMTWNNLGNVIDGREWHYHAPGALERTL